MKRSSVPTQQDHLLLIHLPHRREYCIISRDSEGIPIGDLVACLCPNFRLAEQAASQVIAQNHPPSLRKSA